MSGHSKWATIKRQKGVNDVKRGALFTKLSKAITLAVTQGGGIGDPSQNFKLRLAIDSARSSNMPKDTIQRAIEKGLGKGAVAMEEVIYEGFGPGGVGILVEAATDNKNRTAAEVQNIFHKNGGNLGAMGSVSHLFSQMGQIIVGEGKSSFDEILLEAADSGAQDALEGEGEVFIYTLPETVAKVKDSLTQKGMEVREMEIIRKPLLTIPSDSETEEKVMILLEKLEDLDDVQKTYANLS